MANPKQGLPVIVDVTAHPSGAPKPYTIDWRFVGDPTGKGDTDIVFPRNSGSHNMTFRLNDQSGKGLLFKQSGTDAIWVKSGQGCPTGPGNGGNQMGVPTVSTDRLTLEINDDNSGSPRNLCYMLRFDPDGNNFDPDIRNGGGGVGSGGTSAALTTATGAIAGVVATFLFIDAATSMNFVIGAVIGAAIGFAATLVFNSVGARSSDRASG
jgi:hypothetical protein